MSFSNSLFLMKGNPFLVLLLIVSAACNSKPKTEQIETLEMVEQAAIKKNLALHSQLIQAFQDLGQKPEFLPVLEQAQNVLGKREELGLVLKPGEEPTFPEEKVKVYLDELELIVAGIGERNSGMRDNGISFHLRSQLEAVRNRSEKLLNQEDGLTSHYLLINFLYIEGALLNQLLKELGTHG